MSPRSSTPAQRRRRIDGGTPRRILWGSTHRHSVLSTQRAYECLGVDETTPWDDVMKSYRALAQRHHPDLPTGDTEAMAELNHALDVLRSTRRLSTSFVVALVAFALISSTSKVIHRGP